MTITNIIGAVLGACLVVSCVLMLVFRRWSFELLKRQQQTAFGQSLFRDAGPWAVGIVGVFGVGLGALMFGLGVTGSFA